jgi:DNA-binding transcriptional regulator YdaS (Cro superfamily)
MSISTPVLKAIEVVGSQSELARLVGVSPQAVHAWTKGGAISALCASRIERATAGAITRSDLRPDIFGPLDATPGTEATKPAQLPLHRRNHDHE